MRSDPNDVPAMADETRERALHHAMLVEVAIRAQDQPELWLTAAELALSAQGAALMTLNSALAKTCAKYRTEHEKAGCINPDDDNPGATICNHQCGQCETLQSMARAIDTTMGNIHRERIRNDRPVSPKQLQEIKNLHNLLLGQVHLAAGLAPEHAESFGQTKSRIMRRAAQEQGMEVTEIQVSGKTLAEEQKDNRNPQPPTRYTGWMSRSPTTGTMTGNRPSAGRGPATRWCSAREGRPR